MNGLIYITDYKKQKFWEQEKLSDGENDCVKQVNIYPEFTYQTVKGFGGAFTESSGYNLSLLSEDKQKEIIRDYFSLEGLNYNLGRTHINSCDFSLGNYAYVEDENDTNLNSFHIDRDEKYIIPMIRKAMDVRKGNMTFLASPWSPPGFMKTNGEMNHGGELKKEYYEMWANYIAKYIQTYQSIGIPISMITVQNEPMAKQTWDSCIYSSKQEMEFVRDYLGPILAKKGLSDIKVYVWDHNKEVLYDRADEILSDKTASNYIAGVAFHWYTGDHFDAISLVHEKYPDKELFFTEGCVEYSRFMDSGEVDKAEMYAHDMIGNFIAGMNGYLDWNLILDQEGGPNHVHNFCAAPIMCNTKENTYEKRLTYYYIGHMSRFIKPGAKRIATTKYTDKLEVAAFLNTDGERIVVLMNKSEEDLAVSLHEKETDSNFKVAAHSIVTIQYTR